MVTMNPENRMGRLVYLEDELDVGDEELDLNFLGDRMDGLPNLCINQCHEAALNNAYVEAEHVTTELCTQAAPTCNSDSVRNVAKVAAWPATSHRPYDLARPPSINSLTQTYNDPHGESRVGQPERYNYAKALLESDEELERLAQKIRSEIRQSEMLELAEEAERAADAGLKKFSGRASSFGDDRDLVGLKHNAHGSFSLKRQTTFTEGFIPSRVRAFEPQKIRVLSLRDVTEVIPRFSELHTHMRTHLARSKVDEGTLIYREVVNCRKWDKCEAADDSGPVDPITNQFLENVPGFSMLQIATNRIMNGRGNCVTTSFDDMVEEFAPIDEDSCHSGRFGTALSSHLSPKGSRSRPPVKSLPGLTMSEQIESMLPTSVKDYIYTSRPLHTFDANPCYQIEPYEEEHLTAQTVDTTSSSGSFLAQQGKKYAVCDDTSSSDASPRSSLEENTTPAALFDAAHDDDNDSDCSSHSYLHEFSKLELEEIPYHREEPPAMQTPKKQWSKRTNSNFVTPTGLRDIRRPPGQSAESKLVRKTTENLSTPDTLRITYEPSSIVDSGTSQEPLARQPVSLDEREAIYLALPSIQSERDEICSYYSENANKIDAEQRFRYTQHRFLTTATNEDASMFDDASSPEGFDEKNDAVLKVNKKPESPPAGESILASTSQKIELLSQSFHERDLHVSNEGFPDEQKQMSSQWSRRDIDEHRQDDSPSQQGMKEGKNSFGASSFYSATHSDRNPEEIIIPQELDVHSLGTESSGIEEKKGEDGEDDFLLYWKQIRDMDKIVLPLLDEASNESSSYHDSPVPRNRWQCECVGGENFITKEEVNLDVVINQAETWGGFSLEPTDVKRVMSWPNMAAAVEPALNAMSDLAVPATQLIYADAACNSLASAGGQIMVASREMLCPSFSFPLPTEMPSSPGGSSFQVVVEEVMSRLSPTSMSRRELYYSASANKEFLNNYFYCSKAGDQLSDLELEEALDKDISLGFCHLGSDNVCAGLNELFIPHHLTRHNSAPTLRHRTLSLSGDDEIVAESWFGVLDIASASLSFRFSNTSTGDKTSYRFKPPCLKKSRTPDPSAFPRNEGHVRIGSVRDYLEAYGVSDQLSHDEGLSSQEETFSEIALARPSALADGQENFKKSRQMIHENGNGIGISSGSTTLSPAFNAYIRNPSTQQQVSEPKDPSPQIGTDTGISHSDPPAQSETVGLPFRKPQYARQSMSMAAGSSAVSPTPDAKRQYPSSHERPPRPILSRRTEGGNPPRNVLSL